MKVTKKQYSKLHKPNILSLFFAAMFMVSETCARQQRAVPRQEET